MNDIATQSIYLALASACALAGAIFDIRSRRIPNLLTLPACVLALAIHLLLGGWHEFASALAGGLICGVVFLLFYMAGGMGAGDVKLIAAVGCLGGWPHCAHLLVLTSLAGGAMGLAVALLRGRLKETLCNMVLLAQHHGRSGLAPHDELNVRNTSTLRLPYGVAIAAGCCATLCLQKAGA